MGGNGTDGVLSARDRSLGAPRRRPWLVGSPAHPSWDSLRRKLGSAVIPIFTHDRAWTRACHGLYDLRYHPGIDLRVFSMADLFFP